MSQRIVFAPNVAARWIKTVIPLRAVIVRNASFTLLTTGARNAVIYPVIKVVKNFLTFRGFLLKFAATLTIVVMDKCR